ncbi:MAG: hypothetical protein AAGD34_01525 [Pseudomonadota bacterium]
MVGVSGLGLLTVALSQPAFVGMRIGPGLFAQIFAGGVCALSCLWAVAAVANRGTEDTGDLRHASLLPGVFLIAAVVSFIVLRPAVGLVLTGVVAGVLASIGTGDRSVRALVVSASAAGVVAWVIGTLLLPPTTPLWPWSAHL